MNRVGENIKAKREAANITQEQLAESLNVTRQTVSSWETGRTEPDIDTLHKIAQRLDTTVEELIYGERKTPAITQNVTNVTNVTKQTITKGVGFGAVLAIVISYVKWHSIGWAVLHGLLNWIYVIYFIIKYGWNG